MAQSTAQEMSLHKQKKALKKQRKVEKKRLAKQKKEERKEKAKLRKSKQKQERQAKKEKQESARMQKHSDRIIRALAPVQVKQGKVEARLKDMAKEDIPKFVRTTLAPLKATLAAADSFWGNNYAGAAPTDLDLNVDTVLAKIAEASKFFDEALKITETSSRAKAVASQAHIVEPQDNKEKKTKKGKKDKNEKESKKEKKQRRLETV